MLRSGFQAGIYTLLYTRDFSSINPSLEDGYKFNMNVVNPDSGTKLTNFKF